MTNQMKKDIENRTDIELLVNIFYAKVVKDEQLGFIFQEIAKVNWQTHLAIMYDFWENIILFTGTYQGNPMNLHQHLHHIAPLKASHFQQWNQFDTRIQLISQVFVNNSCGDNNFPTTDDEFRDHP